MGNYKLDIIFGSFITVLTFSCICSVFSPRLGDRFLNKRLLFLTDLRDQGNNRVDRFVDISNTKINKKTYDDRNFEVTHQIVWVTERFNSVE